MTGGSPTGKAPCFGDARVLIVGEWAVRSRRCLESVLGGFVRSSVSQERGFEVSCGNFTAFFDSSRLLQNATNVGRGKKKTKGVLVAV